MAPPGTKDIEFDQAADKEYYLSIGFKEAKVGIAPELIHYLANNTQSQRKQYGLKHSVTSTIHAAMGDTLIRMATELSMSDPNFRLWDKGQLVVLF